MNPYPPTSRIWIVAQGACQAGRVRAGKYQAALVPEAFQSGKMISPDGHSFFKAVFYILANDGVKHIDSLNVNDHKLFDIFIGKLLDLLDHIKKCNCHDDGARQGYNRIAQGC